MMSPETLTHFDALRAQMTAQLFRTAVDQNMARRSEGDPLSTAGELAARALYWTDVILREVGRTPFRDK